MGRWKIVKDEIGELYDKYGKTDKRRTLIPGGEGVEDPEFSEEDFIVAEDNHVLVTADGWIKRQKEIADPGKTRLREGDRVLACEAGSTRATVALFSNFGVCYTARIIDIPATTGYGEPVQKLFKLKDGEKLVAAMSMDPRIATDIEEDEGSDLCPMTHGLAVSDDGFALRFGLANFVEPSTRAGRKYARPSRGARIVGVEQVHGSETILAATEQCRAIVCPAEEVNYLSGPGKGVMLIKLDKGKGDAGADRVLGFKASEGDRDLLNVETNRGATKTISTTKYRTTGRGGKGVEIQKNGRLARVVSEDVGPPNTLQEN